MAENAQEKSRRYLVEGRIRVQHVVGEQIKATCRGDGAVYVMGYDPESTRWFCSCPSPADRCSHLIALRLVTALIQR